MNISWLCLVNMAGQTQVATTGHTHGDQGAAAGGTGQVKKAASKGLKASKNLAAKAMYKTDQKGPVKQNIFSGYSLFSNREVGAVGHASYSIRNVF